MLSHVIDLLADPVDGTPLTGADDFTRLVSESGHSFDVAKQGYVALVGGEGLKHSGDSAAMVAARETFLSLGHFAPFVEAVSNAALDAVDEAGIADDESPAVLEVGAGTGYYLAHTLDLLGDARGVGLDISTAAAKMLAKSHPRVGAVVADIWEGLPLIDASVDVVSVVFAPRNPAEFARILRPGGRVITLTPAAGHLDELRDPLGIIGVEENKLERMINQARGHLEVLGEPEPVEFAMTLDRSAIAAQVGMSPSARHIEDLPARLESLPETMTVTARAHLTQMGLSAH